MSARIHVINFGQASGGLTTIGYTLLNIDGTTKVARSTSGVVEYGTSTGIYGANITYNEFDQLIVLWDTGGANPRYGVEENRITLASIQEGTDFIRMIWNTLKNQEEIFSKILRAVKELERLKNYDAELASIVEKISILVARETIAIKDIKDALTITVNSPEINIPEFPKLNIPDHTDAINSINILIKNMGKTRDNDINDLVGEIESIKSLIEDIVKLHEQTHVKTTTNLGVVNDNVRNVGKSLQDISMTLPPEDFVSNIQGSLKDLTKSISEIKNNKSRLGNSKWLNPMPSRS